MKKTAATTLIAALLLILPARRADAAGFLIFEQGARGTGQAGAFAARADDAESLFYNPAGMTKVKTFASSVGLAVVWPTESKFTLGRDERYPDDQWGKSWEQEKNIFFLPRAYAVYKPTNKLALGLAVNTPFGLKSEWPSWDASTPAADVWPGRFLIHSIEIGSLHFTPTVGYKVNDKLSVAAGVNIVQGWIEMRRAVYLGKYTTGERKPYEGYAHMVGDAVGVGAVLGVQFDPHERVHFGIMYRSAVRLDYDGNANFEVQDPFVYSLPDQKMETTLTLPHVVMTGLAVDILENWSVELDVQVTTWSNLDEVRLLFKESATQDIVRRWKDVATLRLGTEFGLGEHFQGRLGYIYDFNPATDRYVDPFLPDADRNDITAGFSVKAGGAHLDFGYLAALFNKRRTSADNDMPGTYDVTVHIFDISAGYDF